MKLESYNFGKPADIRMAIDLLNSLIADCMVSEQWIRMHVTVPDYIKDAVGLDGNPIKHDKHVLENITDEMLHIREKTVTYWLSLHHGLHRAIDERQPGSQTKTYFDLMWNMFNLNRMKLLGFIEKATQPSLGNCTSLRKQWYGQKHYFTLRDLGSDVGKGLFNILPEHENERDE